MVSEKTARKREGAVLNSVKPCFEKIGRGLEQLEENYKIEAELNEKWREAFEKKSELEEEISIAEQKLNYEEQKRLNKEIEKLQKDLQKIKDLKSKVLFDMSKCDNCGAFMSQVQIVCHKCGSISKCFPYDIEDTETIKKYCYTDLLRLSEHIKMPENLISPYKESEKIIKAMNKILRISELYLSENISKLTKEYFEKIKKEAEGFLRRTEEQRIEIAVVGKVKSGKSTLINALLGTRMASVDCTPETAVLVKYKTTKDKNYIKVSFYSEEQWKDIWGSVKTNKAFIERYEELNAQNVKSKYIDQPELVKTFEDTDELNKEVLHWTSSDYPEYYFVNEVEVGFVGEQFPTDVILVDTPGLSDIVKYRSEITSHYLKNADYVLACVRFETINQQEEAEFLESVLSNLQHDANRMLIVGTKADKENKKEDVVKKQELFFKNMAPLYDKKEGVLRNHFVSVQAEPYLLLQEYISGKETDDWVLESAIRRVGMKLSDVSNLRCEIEKCFGICVLKDNLEKNVYSKTRNQIINRINVDYKKTNQNIRSLAKRAFEVSGEVLLNFDRQFDQHFKSQEVIKENLVSLHEKKKMIVELIERTSSTIVEKGE